MSTTIDLSPFAGRWLNTADKARWLEELTLTQADVWRMTARAVSDGDLGETAVTGYRDNMDGLAFRAEYTLGDRRVALVANTQIELIVITAFHRVGAGDHPENRVQREFFYRARGDA